MEATMKRLRLKLNKESIRRLADADLKQAGGGAFTIPKTLVPTCGLTIFPCL
jgi:hypothetical protein